MWGGSVSVMCVGAECECSVWGSVSVVCGECECSVCECSVCGGGV